MRPTGKKNNLKEYRMYNSTWVGADMHAKLHAHLLATLIQRGRSDGDYEFFMHTDEW